MEPITFTLTWIFGGLILSVVAGAAVWPYITDIFARKIIPFVRRKLGDYLADLLSSMIVWIDEPMAYLREKLVAAWRFFKQSVIKIVRKFRKKSATKVLETTEVWLRSQRPGAGIPMCEERELDWAELPPEIRAEMIRRGSETATIDIGKTVEDRVEERAREQKIELTLATA
jgi:hypothetical protein